MITVSNSKRDYTSMEHFVSEMFKKYKIKKELKDTTDYDMLLVDKQLIELLFHIGFLHIQYDINRNILNEYKSKHPKKKTVLKQYLSDAFKVQYGSYEYEILYAVMKMIFKTLRNFCSNLLMALQKCTKLTDGEKQLLKETIQENIDAVVFILFFDTPFLPEKSISRRLKCIMKLTDFDKNLLKLCDKDSFNHNDNIQCYTKTKGKQCEGITIIFNLITDMRTTFKLAQDPLDPYYSIDCEQLV